MTVWTPIALVVGLAGLVWGADLLVKGAASIATRLGIAPVIVGLTVVAFGTSAPELAVSVGAALGGETDVALGNVVGSNIANVLLILGASAAIGGLVVTLRIIRLDIPLVLFASFAMLLLALDGSIGRLDGGLLFAGVVAYTVWLIRAARSERSGAEASVDDTLGELEEAVVDRSVPVLLGLVAVGLAVLVLGSQLLVGSATDIAEHFGVSELVIGLTVVSVGTSLPELATSVMAVRRGERDIAVGNVVGSNLFNLLSVLGLTGLVAPDGIPVSDAALRLDVPVMIAASLALVPIIWNGFEIRRWEGALLLAFYLAYVAFLVLDASDHAAKSVVGPAILLVTPLVLLTFGVTGFQGWRRYRGGDQPVPS
ncbi:MAG: calcium/sodium antiporter [Acidimicrobiia bacterium]